MKHIPRITLFPSTASWWMDNWLLGYSVSGSQKARTPLCNGLKSLLKKFFLLIRSLLTMSDMICSLVVRIIKVSLDMPWSINILIADGEEHPSQLRKEACTKWHVYSPSRLEKPPAQCSRRIPRKLASSMTLISGFMLLTWLCSQNSCLYLMHTYTYEC